MSLFITYSDHLIASVNPPFAVLVIAFTLFAWWSIAGAPALAEAIHRRHHS